MTELRRRLETRAADAPEVIERRLENARGELSHYAFFDYLLVNDDLELAKQTLVSIVRAELVRCARVAARRAPVAARLDQDPGVGAWPRWQRSSSCALRARLPSLRSWSARRCSATATTS